MEGGVLFLVWAEKLIQNLGGEGYCRSAYLMVQKLCEAIDINWTWTGYDKLGPMEKQA
jgi:hypothetical protein